MWEPLVCGVTPAAGCCGKSRGILRLFHFSWVPMAPRVKERPERVWGLFYFPLC